jgi:hypothetical protein
MCVGRHVRYQRYEEQFGYERLSETNAEPGEHDPAKHPVNDLAIALQRPVSSRSNEARRAERYDFSSAKCRRIEGQDQQRKSWRNCKKSNITGPLSRASKDNKGREKDGVGLHIGTQPYDVDKGKKRG